MSTPGFVIPGDPGRGRLRTAYPRPPAPNRLSRLRSGCHRFALTAEGRCSFSDRQAAPDAVRLPYCQGMRTTRPDHRATGTDRLGAAVAAIHGLTAFVFRMKEDLAVELAARGVHLPIPNRRDRAGQPAHIDHDDPRKNKEILGATKPREDECISTGLLEAQLSRASAAMDRGGGVSRTGHGRPSARRVPRSTARPITALHKRFTTTRGAMCEITAQGYPPVNRCQNGVKPRQGRYPFPAPR